MSVLVRLGPGELAAISGRVQTHLTPEGYEAWYRQDIPAMLTEIMLLQQEAAYAISVLGGEPGEILLDAIQRWQGERSGLWEKQQTRKLREQVLASRQQAEQAEGALHESQSTIDELQRTVASLEAMVESIKAKHEQELNLMAGRVADAIQAGQAKDDEYAKTYTEVLRLHGEIERLQQAANTSFEDWQRKCRDAAKALVEAIG